jgi:hypothetical protein
VRVTATAAVAVRASRRPRFYLGSWRQDPSLAGFLSDALGELFGTLTLTQTRVRLDSDDAGRDDRPIWTVLSGLNDLSATRGTAPTMPYQAELHNVWYQLYFNS